MRPGRCSHPTFKRPTISDRADNMRWKEGLEKTGSRWWWETHEGAVGLGACRGDRLVLRSRHPQKGPTTVERQIMHHFFAQSAVRPLLRQPNRQTH